MFSVRKVKVWVPEKNMKYCILVLAFIAVAQAAWPNSGKISFAHRDPPHPDCAHHAAHIPHDVVDNLNKGVVPDEKNDEVKSHLVCVFKEKKLMSESGSIQKEKYVSWMKKALGEGNADLPGAIKCADVTGNDQKETAYNLYKCSAPLIAKYNN